LQDNGTYVVNFSGYVDDKKVSLNEVEIPNTATSAEDINRVISAQLQEAIRILTTRQGVKQAVDKTVG
jgi:hypothetical protein